METGELAERLTRIEEGDASHQLFGECLATAAALVRVCPELSLAVLWYDEPEDPETEQHVASDGVHVYDAGGVRSLEGEAASAEHVTGGPSEREAADEVYAPLCEVEVTRALEVLGEGAAAA